VKRIAVITSGGDAPGMNAAIRSVVRTAIHSGVEVVGFRRGYAGLIEGDYSRLTARDVGGILEFGGTMLETDRCEEFKTPGGQIEAIAALEHAGAEGLIVIGGDGSQAGSLAITRRGIPVNGVASTIDNDLYGSEMTIGVDTAVNTALQAIDNLRTTARSHRRVFIVETMGRECGYLALAAGVAGGAEVIVTPEHGLTPLQVIERLHEAHRRGKRHALVVTAEGAETNGHVLYTWLKEDPDRYFDPRFTTLGHVQRGGRPGVFDRLLATRLAAKATQLLLAGTHGVLVGLLNGQATSTPLADICGKRKPLPEELLALADPMQI
jgi:6-phosphofructokinase 1